MISPERKLSERSENQPSSVEDSPANLTALRESVRHLVIAVTSGRSCGESFAKLSPDGSWVKTSRGSVQVKMDDSLEEYCETWPRWGIVSDGVAGRLPTLEPRITGNGSSLLPTPRASENDQGNHEKIAAAGSSWKGQNRGATVSTIIAMLPTPQAYSFKNSHQPGVTKLDYVVKGMLPTPTSRDHKDTSANTDYAKLSRKSKLAGRIALLPTVTTPRAHDSDETCIKAYMTKNQKDIPQVLGASCGLKLQPAFAEWMMGFPLNWTEVD
jgi:hypothetical protein